MPTGAAETKNNLFSTACSHLDNRDYHRAITILEELAAEPDTSAAVLSKLGIAYISSGRHSDAIACFKNAILKDPGYSQAYNNLMLALYESGDSEGAAQICRDAIGKFSDGAPFLSFLSHLYRENAETEKAKETLLRLVETAPSDSTARCNLGIVCQELGQENEAIGNFERALTLDPMNTEALRILAYTKNGFPGPEEIEKLEGILKTLPGNDKRASDVHFALARYFDGRRDYQKAFSHYKAANDIVARKVNYDIGREETSFEKIKQAFTDDFIKTHRVRGGIGRPVFIVGMPRSGTSLVEQILASHSMVSGGGEMTYLQAVLKKKILPYPGDFVQKIRALGPGDCAEMAATYLQKAEARSGGRPCVTDKMPHNFRLIGLIKTLFPQAAIIHCVRDPLDTCISLYTHYFPASNMGFTYSLSGLGRYYRLYRDIMAHWHSMMPGEIHDVRYEDIVHDQKGVTERLLSCCGLPWEDACLDFHRTQRPVSTASALQVKKPLYATSVKAWERFAPYIGTLTEIIS